MPIRRRVTALGGLLFVLAACQGPGATSEPCADDKLACEGACVDVASDPSHCGACSNACPRPTHANARCVVGRCARGPCEKGFFDLDGDVTPGCEATCQGRTCTGPAGTVTLDAAPLVEASIHLGSPVSAGAAGSFTQTSPGYTNVATLGEPTPPPAGGTGTLTGSTYKLVGGLNAAHTAP